MKQKLCKKCEKEIIGRNKKATFCSDKCRVGYNSKKRRLRNSDNKEFLEYHRNKSREWYQNNKERQNKNVLRDYFKNKDKWRIRQSAINNKKDIFEVKGSVCEKCGSKENLEMHHLEYKRLPRYLCSRWNKKERILFYCSIIQILCKKCHIKVSVENRKF